MLVSCLLRLARVLSSCRVSLKLAHAAGAHVCTLACSLLKAPLDKCILLLCTATLGQGTAHHMQLLVTCERRNLCSCLQAVFGFFSRLNSYWVAPLVNVVFIAAAVLTQLFLATMWGKAVLAWLAQKQFSTKKASSVPFDATSEDMHGCNLYEPETEHQRLLASAELQGTQSYGVSGPQSAVRLEPLYEGPAAFSVEMADLDALHQHTNLQEGDSQPGNKA